MIGRGPFARSMLAACSVLALLTSVWLVWERDPGRDQHRGPDREKAATLSLSTTERVPGRDRDVASGATEAVDDAVVLGAPGSLRGVVLKGDRREPAAGAALRVESQAGGDVLKTISGQDGRFRIDSLPLGSYLVEARLEGWVDTFSSLMPRTLRLGEEEPNAEAVIVLERGCRVSGIVVDARDRQPVAGADVHWGRDHQTTSDGEGSFELGTVRPGHLRIVSSAPGYCRTAVHIAAEAGKAIHLEVALEPGFSAHGVVRDATGRAVPEARVLARIAGRTLRAVADAEGRYEAGGFDRVPSPLVVTATHPLGGCSGVATAFWDPESTSVELDVELGSGQDVGGTVEFESRPIAGAPVYVDWASSGPAALTDAAGRFRVPCAGQDASLLSVVHRGFAPASVRLDEVPSEERSNLQITLERSAPLRGRVLDPADTPVPNAAVSVDGRLSHAGPPIVAMSGVDGEFEIPAPPRSATSISVQKPGFCTTVQSISIDRDPEEPLTLRLEPAGVILGLVVDAQSGDPVRSFRVRVSDTSQSLALARSLGGFGLPAALARRGVSFQSPEGRFRVSDDLRAGGRYDVEIVAPGYERTSAANVEASPVSSTSELVIELTRGGAVEVLVLSSVDGRPVEGALVRERVPVRGAPGRSDRDAARRGTTGPEGMAYLEGLPVGPVELVVESAGFARALRRLEIETDHRGPIRQELEIVLVSEAVIEGRVVTGRGEPVEGAEIWAAEDSGPRLSDLSDDHGRFEVRELVEGKATLEVKWGRRSVRSTASVRAGERVTHEIVLGGSLIEGTVVSGIDRKPLESATVVLLGQKPSGHEDRGVSWRIEDETTLLSSAESFRFENFRGGEFVLAAFPSPTIRQAIGWTSPLSVGEGESLTDVQIVAGAPAHARVTVLSAASGEAVGGAFVQLRADGGQRRRASSRSDAYGVADLDEVVEGTYTLRCDADGFLPFREALDVRGTLEIPIRLTPASWMTCRFDHPAAASNGANQWTLEMTVQRHDPAVGDEWVDVERIRRMVDLRLSDHARLQVPVGRLRLLYSLSRDRHARVDGTREVTVQEGSDTRETIPVEAGEREEPRSTGN